MGALVHPVNQKSRSVGQRRSLFIWGLFCAICGMIFLAYVLASLNAGYGEIIMPLDDVYIHFQYARQMAHGQPYVYNPGLPPSSGATSFLYPYLLAAGYLLGFQDLNLGLWAMLLGTFALLGSMRLIHLLCRAFDSPDWVAVFTALLFALTGAVSWHFMSGMETGIVILFTLLTLYTVLKLHFWMFIASAFVLALLRPEGGVLAILGIIGFILQYRHLSPQMAVYPRARWHWLALCIPVLGIGVQPLVNLIFTGSAVASGNSAKSVLGSIPFYPDVVITRLVEQFTRMWAEFITGLDSGQIIYIPLLLALLAIITILVLLLRRRTHWPVVLMVLAWWLAATLAVSTLDTAFWHFKRYQMPLIALFFPLAGWGVSILWGTKWKQAVFPLLLVFGLTAAWTWTQFYGYFALNGQYVYAQPVQMARWLKSSTPENVTVAVHDTGMLRYEGGRTTIDIVGLTTPGAADYWRNGPGSVGEFLIAQQPDYIASYGYGHGYGLGMLADTDVYGEPLAAFPVTLDPDANVALAADSQAIYAPNWDTILLHKADILQPSTLHYLTYLQDAYSPETTHLLDVADLVSERAFAYQWSNPNRLPGYPTELRQMNYVDCALESCEIVDGGRQFTGEEFFTLKAAGESRDIILVTRLHPLARGSFDVYAGDETFVATRWIPDLPGSWLEVATLIPASLIPAHGDVSVRIVPNILGGFYAPYQHRFYEGRYQPAPMTGQPITTFQDGAIIVADAELNYQPDLEQLLVNLDWYAEGGAVGDYKIFIHVLDSAGGIIAQADQRPGGNTLPPGNWLPGGFRDTIVVNLKDIQSGNYQVAFGLYDPVSFANLLPSGGDEVGRYFIGDVEIVGDE